VRGHGYGGCAVSDTAGPTVTGWLNDGLGFRVLYESTGGTAAYIEHRPHPSLPWFVLCYDAAGNARDGAAPSFAAARQLARGWLAEFGVTNADVLVGRPEWQRIDDELRVPDAGKGAP